MVAASAVRKKITLTLLIYKKKSGVYYRTNVYLWNLFIVGFCSADALPSRPPSFGKIAGLIPVHGHFATPFSKRLNVAMLTMAAIAPPR